jgi:glutathione synthase
LPAIAQGDERVLIIGGKPVPFCLARIPQGGESAAGQLAAGGQGVAQPLNDNDRAIAESVGAVQPRSLLLIGLDVIGTNVTEINVTSPTCFQEIFDQTGCDVASIYIDALEAAVKATPHP